MTNKATTEVVSALANPVRLTILYEIAAVGTARTSDIAQALDMAANKVSYHLKRLESAGVIRKEPGTDARETWWSAVPGGWEVNEPELTPALPPHFPLFTSMYASAPWPLLTNDAGAVSPYRLRTPTPSSPSDLTTPTISPTNSAHCSTNTPSSPTHTKVKPERARVAEPRKPRTMARRATASCKTCIGTISNSHYSRSGMPEAHPESRWPCSAGS